MSSPNPVFYFPQANFCELVRQSSNSGGLAYNAYDDDTVFHIYYQDEPGPTSAFYLRLQAIPEEEKLEEVAQRILATATDGETKLVVFVPESDDLGFTLVGYTKKSSSSHLNQANILLLPSDGQFHSRSILETNILSEMSVCVVGLGSGGSHIAVELAKAGVGHFVLIDYDRLELNNIARHVCGTRDIGRLKTNALKDVLLTKSPGARVDTFDADINEAAHGSNRDLSNTVRACNLIVAATDSIQSRRNINTLSVESGIPTVYGKCSTRAAGGEVLIVRPGTGPCLACIYGQIAPTDDEASSFQRERKKTPAYVADSTVEATIQVGLSSDIIPIGNMVVKLALVELSRGKESGISSLEYDLRFPFYRWANRREEEFAPYPKDGFARFDTPSVLRWYPVSFKKKDDCLVCGERELSQDADFFGSS
ncbi:ubiquitin-like modifier-activating enzyme 5 [Oscarella lobularis]|uniref:ubiquitin-like modifier-activating enzyme 5 n=1 Tax=Oscarella lobularis TaxID=121494 RepID=UPI0033143D2E